LSVHLFPLTMVLSVHLFPLTMVLSVHLFPLTMVLSVHLTTPLVSSNSSGFLVWGFNLFVCFRVLPSSVSLTSMPISSDTFLPYVYQK
jgi:hypothetical protein